MIMIPFVEPETRLKCLSLYSLPDNPLRKHYAFQLKDKV